MKRSVILPLSIFLLLSLSSCGESAGVSSVATNSSDIASVQTEPSKPPTPSVSSEDLWKQNEVSITLGSTIHSSSTNGVKINKNIVTITKGGDYSVSGTLSDGMLHVNSKERVKLRLSGASITNKTGPAIFIEDAKKAFITLSAGTENYLTDGSSYSVEAKGALFSNDTLEIKGAGKLFITGNFKHGVCSDDDIIIEEGTLHINSSADGLRANDNITILNGDITIRAGTDGMESEGDIVIQDGRFDIQAGKEKLTAFKEITITGSNLKNNF